MAEPLPSTRGNSTVRLISTREESPPRPEAAPSPVLSPAFLQQMTAVMTAIAAILAARLLLLLAAMGAFALALLTVGNPDAMKLSVNAAYDLLVFCPLVYLYIRKG